MIITAQQRLTQTRKVFLVHSQQLIRGARDRGLDDFKISGVAAETEGLLQNHAKDAVAARD